MFSCVKRLRHQYERRAFRRKVLAALDVDCKEEMEWVKGIAAENPKNYQIWCASLWTIGGDGPDAGPAVGILQVSSQGTSREIS